MRTRVAAALQKMLMFQDVRASVADATPSVVAPLVGLLQHPKGASSKKRGRGSPEQSGSTRREGKQGHQQEKKKHHRGVRRAGAGDEFCGEEEARNAAENLTSKAPLHAAACLRVLALSEGFPEIMASASAVPALVDGLKSGSPLMQSVCGGCLASLAPCDEECCMEMIDFGVLPTLLGFVRDRDPLLELTAWSVLAAIMRVREAREAFVKAGGTELLEGVLTRKQRRTGSNRFLLAIQESAMRVLLKLCEEEERDHDERDKEQEKINGGRGDSKANSPTIPSMLLLDDNRSNASDSSGHPRNDDSGNSTDEGNAKRRDLRRVGKGGRTGEIGIIKRLPTSSSISDRSGCNSDGEGGDQSSASPRLETMGDFVSKEGVFRGLLRQMKGGTQVSMKTAVEVLRVTWRACSSKQVDSTMPLVLDMLASDTWMLKSAAAQVVLHVYQEDDQRLRCAASGGVKSLIDTIRTKTPQMQAGTLAALLSLCEHPDVPAVVAAAGGLEVLAEYLTTARDITTRYVVLAMMKVALVCERLAVEPYLPDMLVSEHVLGASDEIDEFVRVFVEKRKSSDYLPVGVANVCRFAAKDIVEYKSTFKELDKDASGALDERELGRLLKHLKVDSRKKTVKNVLLAVDKNNSGMVEFDEFLDIMWDIKHAKGRARGLLFGRAGIFLEGTIAAAQAALRGKTPRRQHVKTSASVGEGGVKVPSATRTGSRQERLDTSNTTATSIATGEEGQQHGQEGPPQERQEAAPATAVKTTSVTGAIVARGKEATLSFLPKITVKKMTWKGFS
ncbi:unnamed protein product [Ectocarpus sp. 4 AP-2014]